MTTRYRYATRLNSFHASSATATVSAALRAVAAVPGITAVELNYPQHVTPGDDSAIAEAQAAGLAVTALNLRFDEPSFVAGAFTHPDAANRETAIATCLAAVDIASQHGIDHVILWMGPDGFDYPLQADYDALWAMEIEGFRRVVAHDPAIRISVEYKPSDPRRVSLIRSMGEALLAVGAVDLPNFGVTLDVCHSLMAGEQPAAAAALALRARRLFGVHLNDGYGPADDGLMVGSIHPWQTLDLLRQLRAHAFAGTIYFDTFPDRVDPAAECAANVRAVERFERLLDRLERSDLSALQLAQDAVGVSTLLRRTGWGEGDE